MYLQVPQATLGHVNPGSIDLWYRGCLGKLGHINTDPIELWPAGVWGAAAPQDHLVRGSEVEPKMKQPQKPCDIAYM